MLALTVGLGHKQTASKYAGNDYAVARKLEVVTDEATFLAFVQALAQDRRADGKTWENDSIEDFLEAAGSWADDSGFGASQGLSAASPWKKFALFLYCGKIYE